MSSLTGLILWSFYLHTDDNKFLAFAVFNLVAFFIILWFIQIIFLQFYFDLKFCKNLSQIPNSQSDFFNKAWISASKAYLNRQNARTIEDLADFKEIRKNLDTLKKTIENSKMNPNIKEFKVLETSQRFVQASIAKVSSEMENVIEEETRLIEELKLHTFLEIKAEIFYHKISIVKFIEENFKRLEEKGCIFNLSNLNLASNKPIERFAILQLIINKFTPIQVSLFLN